MAKDSSSQDLAPRFTELTSSMAPLPIDNIDTDQIIPAVYLKTTSREGLAEGLFAGWRGGGVDFVLDNPRYASARILLGGDNFGCGSSREHAPWALLDHGIRAVVSTRFADIFRSNALRNGLLPVVMPGAVLERLMDATLLDPDCAATIHLERQILTTPWGEAVPFEVDAFARRCLLEGVDAFGYLLSQLPTVEAYEAQNPSPWDTRSIVDGASS